jgi:hypothetical protein
MEKLKIILLIALAIALNVSAFGQEKKHNNCNIVSDGHIIKYGAYENEKISEDSIVVGIGYGTGEGATEMEAISQAYAEAMQELYTIFFSRMHLDIFIELNKPVPYLELPPVTTKLISLEKTGEKCEAHIKLITSISRKELDKIEMTLDSIINNIK